MQSSGVFQFVVLGSCLTSVAGTLSLATARKGDDDTLPDVDSILTRAKDTLKDFSSQALEMQQRVTDQDKASRDALAAARESYESKLAEQEHATALIEVANKDLEKEIGELDQGNQLLKQGAKKVKRSNNVLREAIRVMGPKMNTATQFLEESLKVTDGTSSKVLKVLDVAPEPSLEHFLEVLGKTADSSSDAVVSKKKSMSLLSVQATDKSPKKAEDMVKMLGSKLGDLVTAGQEGETKLKASFIARFEQGSKKQEEVLAKQEELKATRDEQVALQKELHAAKQHLGMTQRDLQNRLEALQTFVQTADSIVNDAIRDADAVGKNRKTKTAKVQDQANVTETTTE